MINPAEEFRRHADECRRMARDARDPASKGTWNRLADRWNCCAELAKARQRRRGGGFPDTDTTSGRFIGTLPKLISETASVLAASSLGTKGQRSC